ncbi:MAG: succinate dehydrogenase cytochrome b subunit [Bifidobacteriaceae bacterium]|jgi:succinate dehydrogenase / fumarate reductase cytochrome b subunit|nr:succinate dehydrogenase cytochrome b subunit [Bifidobacteriaceae bacterium]
MPAAKRPGTEPPPRPETWVLKVIQAATGSVFVAFVLFHLAGNLKVYLPDDPQLHFNEYAHWLRGLLNPLLPGETFLWLFRAALALCLVLHVYAGLTIWARARRARGRFGRSITATKHHLFGRTMIWSGLIILAFIVFHLLDLTIGRGVESKQFSSAPTYPLEGTDGVVDAYANLVHSFERLPVAIFYVVVMLVVAFHLSHGIWSIINDFGGTARRTRNVFLFLADVIALIVVIGNASIPLAVLAGGITL